LTTRPHFIAVSTALASQCEALDVLLYRLGVLQLLRSTGSQRWLARARDDVNAAVDMVQLGEVLRAAHAEELAVHLGLDADASLTDLAEASPEPWHTALVRQGDELRSLYAQVDEAAAAHPHAYDTRQLSLLTFLR
jgi:hypothetical protein